MKFVDDKYFINLIKDKRVALIGPGEYVCKELDDTHGKYIDSFDLVVKVNNMIKLPDVNLEKYYGKRIDILISSLWTVVHPDLTLHTITHDKNIKCDRYNNIENYKHIDNELTI